MADRYLLESGAPDGYLLEDGSGVLLLEGVSALTADFAQTLGALTSSATASVATEADLAQSLGAVSLSAAAVAKLAAAAENTLGAVVATGAAGAVVAAAFSQTLGAVTLSAAGTLSEGRTAELSLALGEVLLASAGASAIAGALSLTLDQVQVSAEADSAAPRAADLAQALGSVGLSADATVAQPEAPQASTGRNRGVVWKKGRRKPSFIGVPDEPQRQQPRKAPPRRASLQITLGRIGCGSDASLGINPAVLRRRRVAVALLLS